jgi:hypothetical protein
MDYFVTFVILGSVRSRMLQKPESLQSEIRNPKSTIERPASRNTKPVMRNS